MTRRFASAVAFFVLGAGTVMLLPGTDQAKAPAAASSQHRVDIGFSQDMVAHHQQAVDMAHMVRDRVSPPVAQFASSIEMNQLKEIGQMQGWLALWNAPQVASGPPMAWMTGHHGHGTPADRPMPGMASLDDLEQLGARSGKDLDVWFLQLMIRHHQGGLTMTGAAARDAAHAQVRGLALVMTAEQHKEIGVMAGLLAGLGHRPLPAPT